MDPGDSPFDSYIANSNKLLEMMDQEDEEEDDDDEEASLSTQDTKSTSVEVKEEEVEGLNTSALTINEKVNKTKPAQYKRQSQSNFSTASISPVIEKRNGHDSRLQIPEIPSKSPVKQVQHKSHSTSNVSTFSSNALSNGYDSPRMQIPEIPLNSPVKTPIRPDSPSLYEIEYKKKRLYSRRSPEPDRPLKIEPSVNVKEELLHSPIRNVSPSHSRHSADFQFAKPSTPPIKEKKPSAQPQTYDFTKEPKQRDIVIMNNIEYMVLKEVGKGSSGKVFEVFSKKDHARYALKWIQIKSKSDTDSIMNEIELLRSLKDQQRIVAIVDYYSTPSSMTIIMEFGEIDLAHLIQKQQKKKWDPSFIKFYWRQMLECVNTIHNRRILHSDLKPANFVLVKGRLKLIDFGIAKKVNDDTTNVYRDVQAGTVNYMSPEALSDITEGKENVDSLMKIGRASDVWALGCILYQMIYGKTPFYHLKLQQKLICIPNPGYAIAFPETTQQKEDPEPVNIPKSLIEILQGCLTRDPSKRLLLTELLEHPFASDF